MAVDVGVCADCDADEPLDAVIDEPTTSVRTSPPFVPHVDFVIAELDIRSSSPMFSSLTVITTSSSSPIPTDSGKPASVISSVLGATPPPSAAWTMLSSRTRSDVICASDTSSHGSLTRRVVVPSSLSSADTPKSSPTIRQFSPFDMGGVKSARSFRWKESCHSMIVACSFRTSSFQAAREFVTSCFCDWSRLWKFRSQLSEYEGSCAIFGFFSGFQSILLSPPPPNPARSGVALLCGWPPLRGQQSALRRRRHTVASPTPENDWTRWLASTKIANRNDGRGRIGFVCCCCIVVVGWRTRVFSRCFVQLRYGASGQ
mmetsp:Transcript_22996/g.48955  ORF Transcript_22996/g.48955 Transcript_22996/m.48955 type:complete len:316 (-) Transcript_22996:15-962(-)